MSILTSMIFNGSRNQTNTLLLAHGAGAPMDSPIMEALARGLADTGLCVGRFEFPYMQRRRAEGTRRPPDRAPILIQAWADVVTQTRPTLPKGGKLFIGGRSMGGRMATLAVADGDGPQLDVDGLVCLGYPFHPAGKPEKTRTDHLLGLKTPTLIVQGTRDPMGTTQDVAGYDLSAAIKLHWLEDGDHDFKPRKKSGRTEDQNRSEGIAAVIEFIKSV